MRRILFCICFSILIFSCNSDDDNLSLQPESNFYALTVGNSWVYKWYRFDDDIEESSGVTESVTIMSTEEINSQIYYKFKSVISGNPLDDEGNSINPYLRNDGEYIEFKRDSVGYLIDHEGGIKFANSANEEFLAYGVPWESTYGELTDFFLEYSTEAGVFECVENTFKLVVNSTGEVGLGRDYHYFSDGIGLISEKNALFINCDFCGFYEKRLDSYIIN